MANRGLSEHAMGSAGKENFYHSVKAAVLVLLLVTLGVLVWREAPPELFDPNWIEERLNEAELRNLQHFGYGIKAFALSMIETAIDLTEGRIAGSDLKTIIDSAKEMLAADVELLEHVAVIAYHQPAHACASIGNLNHLQRPHHRRLQRIFPPQRIDQVQHQVWAVDQ